MIMKKNLLYTAAVIAAMSLGSCSDLLETESLSNDNLEYLCSNPTDARKMINHVYSYFCEDTYTSRMSTNWMQNTDVEVGYVGSDQCENADRRGLWALNPRYFSDILKCWDNSLAAIDFANQCIKGIEESSMYLAGDADMKQLHGEAYCLRAYWYWLMCNFWGDVPFSTAPTTFDNLHNDPRKDKNIIYSRLIQDLINVEEEMKWAEKTTTETMNRDFALGFIVKLSMFRAGYSMQADGTMARSTGTGDEYTVKYIDENGAEAIATTADDYYKVAKAYALKLINLKDRDLETNFKTIFDNEINGCNPANSDVLFEMGFVPNSGGDIGWCHGLTVEGGTRGEGKTYTNLTPYYAYSFDSEDQRLPVTCANYKWMTDNKQAATNGSGIMPAKWCRLDLDITGVKDKGTGINWPVLRYTDVLLLLAEAENEINRAPTALAKQMLTRVRERAFINSANKAQKVIGYVNGLSSYEDFREAIMDERAWEFGGENIRKFDLIRWNYYDDAIVNLIDWTYNVCVNYLQVEEVNGELIYNKDKEIADMGFAPTLYYNYTKGRVVYENDYFTYRDNTEEPYKSAVTVSEADELKEAGVTLDGVKKIDILGTFLRVSSKDANNQSYGKDENGDDIKKGLWTDTFVYSYFGFTESALSGDQFSLEGIKQLRGNVVPYVIPIPADRISASNGVLSNEGYAIRNK